MQNQIGTDLNIVEVKTPVSSENNIWDKEKIKYYDNCIFSGIKPNLPTPYYENRIGYRKSHILYQYSEEELGKLEKCANDVVYFSEKYCMTMTDEGIRNVNLYPHQQRVLREISNENRLFHLLMAARQSQKTSTISFFLTWFLCFNFEKNILVVANKGETMQEVIDKIRIVYEHLPYFIKPGIIENNKKRLTFDNGCRIIGQATTLKPGLGFNIHLLYIDEFAHIPSYIIEPFYHAIYPTISASKIARVIITSTPFGLNLFYKLYHGALLGKNKYNPIRVDWWEVPGRDERWKQEQIENLGSEAAFNQEYGNQFLNTSQLLVSADMLQKFDTIKIDYKTPSIPILDDLEINYSELKIHPDYIDLDFINDKQVVMSIDLAEGVGRDYTVINIFIADSYSLDEIDNINRTKIKDETDFFKLKQVGIYRSNLTSLSDFSILLDALIFKIFNVENLLIVLEVNKAYGSLILNKLELNPLYDSNIFLHTFHTLDAKQRKPGLKLTGNNKPLIVSELTQKLKENKIELTEKDTLLEISSYGFDTSTGKYTSQIGNDDVVMSCANVTELFKYKEWNDIVEETYENLNDTIKYKIDNILELMEDTLSEGDFDDYDLLKQYI